MAPHGLPGEVFVPPGEPGTGCPPRGWASLGPNRSAGPAGGAEKKDALVTLTSARRLASLAAVTVVTVLASLAAGPGALADPGDDGASEGIQKAIQDFLDAEEQLNTSKERQKTIEKQIKANEKVVEELSQQVQDIAAAAYMGGNLGSTTAILGAESLDLAIDRALLVNFLGEESAKTVAQSVQAQEDLKAEKDLLAEEVENQKKHLGKMEDARDNAAEQLASGGGNSGVGPTTNNARVPDPAPRNPDGSLPGEGCSINEGKTGGCISPRTRHARDQAIFAGFERYVSCFRPSGSGEHPLGKACDFSVAPGGFQNEVAYGDDKAYGDNLAGWFVKYADRLGVLYVIWFNQFWSPATGWEGYTGGGGDPASDHTNHVHLSMR